VFTAPARTPNCREQKQSVSVGSAISQGQYQIMLGSPSSQAMPMDHPRAAPPLRGAA
jgi:hypothetical protein